MEAQFKKLFDEMLEDLDLYNDIGILAVGRVTGIIGLIQAKLREIRIYINEHPFADAEQEIWFFKRIKPSFVAEQLFAVEYYTLENNRPVGDEVVLKAYYEFELKHIRRFFDKHRYLHQYYLLDGHELDHLYFLRGAAAPVIVKADLPDVDPEFSTAADYLFARFIAYERLQEHLVELLYPSSKTAVPKGKDLSWPGDKTDLIEMAYGIYCWLQAHGAKVTIVEMINWLEESFSVKLPRHYRRFAEIKMRKISSRTKFFDELRDLLLQYMDEGDAWRPVR